MAANVTQPEYHFLNVKLVGFRWLHSATADKDRGWMHVSECLTSLQQHPHSLSVSHSTQVCLSQSWGASHFA